MYYLWKEKGMLPSTFYNLKAGEKVVLRAFSDIKIKDDYRGGE